MSNQARTRLGRERRWEAGSLAMLTALGLAGCDGVPAPDAGGVPELSLTPLPPIRAESVADQAPFGNIADLEIGSDGSVYVLDGLNRSVRVFDQAGLELRSFGGRGQGPGELERPSELLWGPEDDLWVLDVGNGRLTAFEPTGELVATYRPADLPIFFPFAVGFSEAGALRWVGLSSPDPAAPAAAWIETRLAGDEITLAEREDLPFVEWPLLFEHRTEELAVVLPVPFSGEPLFAFDPAGRLWYGFTGEPRVHRWSTSGGLEMTLGRELTPRPVTAANRRAALAGPDYEEIRSGLGQAAVAELSDMIPDRQPYLAGIFFDDEERIWVVRHPEDAEADGTRTLDVYDLEGRPVAVARAAFATDPRPRVRDGLLAAVVRDEFEVESLALYRVGR